MQRYGWRRAVLLSDVNTNQPVCSYGATSINNYMNSDDVTAANYSIFYIAMVDQPSADVIASYLDTIAQQSRGENRLQRPPTVDQSTMRAGATSAKELINCSAKSYQTVSLQQVLKVSVSKVATSDPHENTLSEFSSCWAFNRVIKRSAYFGLCSSLLINADTG